MRMKLLKCLRNTMFFVLFGGFYLGVLFLSDFILSAHGSYVDLPMNTTDQRLLAGSILCGFILGFDAVLKSITHLLTSYKAAQYRESFKHLVDVLLSCLMSYVPILIAKYADFIRENINSAFWVSLTGLFIAMAALHFSRMNRKRYPLKEVSCA